VSCNSWSNITAATFQGLIMGLRGIKEPEDQKAYGEGLQALIEAIEIDRAGRLMRHLTNRVQGPEKTIR
jgi:hypothetical protein